MFGLEGSYGEPLLRQFALFSPALRFAHLTCLEADFVFDVMSTLKVDSVNFLDDLHGECYVELRSKEDLARALDKHALRVGTRLRRRLIEVYLSVLIELQIEGYCRCTLPLLLR